MDEPADSAGRLTYGALVEQARQAAAVAACAPPVQDAAYAVREASGLASLVVVAGRHARFLARPFRRSHPARILSSHVQVASRALVGMGQPDRSAASATLWDGACERLGVAHDLLLSQVGPDREPLGPDARLLDDPAVVATAVGRVAVIVGLAAAAAQEMVARPPGSGLGGRVRPGLLAPSVLWPLHLVAALADPAAVVVEQCAGMGRPYVLDDVGPLLGDENAPLWERRLGQLRLAVHALGQPGHGPGRDLLAALADFGLGVSVQAGRTAGRAADHGPAQHRRVFGAARAQAADSAEAWRAVRAELRDLRSLGTDGARVIDLAVSLERHVDGLVRKSGQRGMPAGPAALAAVRSAVLVLPDLATGSAAIAGRLRDHDLLWRLIGSERYSRVPSTAADRLLATYSVAAAASRHLLAACTALPGEAPSPSLSAYLTTPASPSSKQARPAAQTREDPPGPAATWAEIRDEERGVIRCPTSHLVAALRHDDDTLRGMLHLTAPSVILTGRERRLTLAALVASHLPAQRDTSPTPGQPPTAPELDLPPAVDGPGL